MRFGSLLPFQGREEDPFVALRREMDRMFDVFGHGLPDVGASWDKAGRWAPRVNVEEDKDALTVTAELPGVDENDIECSLGDGMLTIKGEKRTETEEKKKDFYIAERTYGAFYRAIPLPFAVQEDKAEATFEKGVLKLRLPKTSEAKKAERRIAIKTGRAGQPKKAA